jgi:hypothetical protein
MVDETRAKQWELEARSVHARYYGTQDPLAHFAGIVLALLRERDDLLRHLERDSALQGK